MFLSAVKQPTLPITADVQALPQELLVKIFEWLLLRSQKNELQQSYSSISKTCRLWSQISKEPSLERLFFIRLAILFSPSTQSCLSSIQDGEFAPYTQVLLHDAKTRYGELYSQLEEECQVDCSEEKLLAVLKWIDLVCDWAKMPSSDLQKETVEYLSKASLPKETPIEYKIKYADLLHRFEMPEKAQEVFTNIFEHLASSPDLINNPLHAQACKILVDRQPVLFIFYFVTSAKAAQGQPSENRSALIYSRPDNYNPLFIPEALKGEFFGLIPWNKVEIKRLATWVDALANKIYCDEKENDVSAKAQSRKTNYHSILDLLKEKHSTLFKNLLPHLLRPYNNYPDTLAWNGFQQGALTGDPISDEAFQCLLCIRKFSRYQKNLEELIKSKRLSAGQLRSLFEVITDLLRKKYFSDKSLQLLGWIAEKGILIQEQRSTLKEVLWWVDYFKKADAPGAANVFKYLGFKEIEKMLLQESNNLEQRALCCQWLYQQPNLFLENREKIFEIGCTLATQWDESSRESRTDAQVSFLCSWSTVALQKLNDRKRALGFLTQAFKQMECGKFRLKPDVFVDFFQARFHPILYDSSEERRQIDAQLESLIQSCASVENASAGKRTFIRNFLAHRAVVDVEWAKQSLEGVLNRIGDFGGDFYQLVSWMLSRSEPHLKSIAQTFVKNHIESRGDKAELYNEILNSIPWHKIEPEQVTYWLIILSSLNEWSQFELIQEVQSAAEWECSDRRFTIRNTFYRALWRFPTSVVDRIRFFDKNYGAFKTQASQSDFKEMYKELLFSDIPYKDRIKSYTTLAAHLNIFELSSLDREAFLRVAIGVVRSTREADVETLWGFYRKVLVHVDAPVIEMTKHFLKYDCKQSEPNTILLDAIYSYCKDPSLVAWALRIIFDSVDDPLKLSLQRWVPPEEILSAILNDDVRSDQLEKAFTVVNTLVDDELKSPRDEGRLLKMLRLKNWYEKIAILSKTVLENEAQMIADVETQIVRVDEVIEEYASKQLGALFSLSGKYPKLRELWRGALKAADLGQVQENTKEIKDLSLARDILAVFGEKAGIEYLFRIFFPDKVKNTWHYEQILLTVNSREFRW